MKTHGLVQDKVLSDMYANSTLAHEFLYLRLTFVMKSLRDWVIWAFSSNQSATTCFWNMQ